MTPAIARIRDWGERFRKNPLAGSVVTGLDRRSTGIWQRTFELLQRESPEYRNSVDEEFTRESQSHCRALLKAIIAIAAGWAGRGDADPFAFVRTHAQWRARHQVPLIASLHAYRLAHKTYWEITRESLLRHPDRDQALLALTMLSDFWLELFDCIGGVLAEAHAAEEGLIVAQNTRAYFALIDDLLRGIEPRTAEARRLRTLCGIRPGAPAVVAVARPFPSTNGKPVDVEVTLRSVVRLIQQVLPSEVFGKLVDIRNEEVTVIACSDAGPARHLLRILRRHGFGRRAPNGLAACVGVGLDAADAAGLPQSLQEARLALEFAGPAQPVLHFAEIELPEFLIRHADPTAVRLIPDSMRRLISSGGELARTVRMFAECSLNVKQTARRLGVHTNTVYFRLNRVHRLTGTDPRTFSGASFLLAALRLLQARAGPQPGI